MFTEVLEELREKGVVKDDADWDTIFELLKAEIDRIYRGRSLKVAKERFYKFQKRWLEKRGVYLPPY